MITVTNGQVPRSLLVPVAGQWLRAGTAFTWIAVPAMRWKLS